MCCGGSSGCDYDRMLRTYDKHCGPLLAQECDVPFNTFWSTFESCQQGLFTCLAQFVQYANAAVNTNNGGTFDLSLRDSAPVCVGKICDSSNAFYYYSCCDTLATQCCFHLQQWVIITLVVLGILTLASFAIGLIKCICCCNDR